MPIRLNIPKPVRLHHIIKWTDENRVPVVFQEMTISGPEAVIMSGDRFSRHGYARTLDRWIQNHDLRVMNYDARKKLGFSKFQLLVRPRDEVLLTVRFGLSRVC